jgi:hypothetical protein
MKLRICRSDSNRVARSLLFRAAIFTVAATVLLGTEIAAQEVVQLSDIEFRCPEPETPYFHVRAKVSSPIADALALKGAEVNGEPARGGRWDQMHGLLALPVRWRTGQSYTLRVTFATKDETLLRAEVSAQAPAKGGMWHPDWAHYAAVVLAEEAGLGRTAEPVHVTLSVYADQVGQIEDEIRVVRLDGGTGAQKEVPSQVYAVTTWTKPADDVEYEPTRYQSTVTCEVAFLADVEADAKQLYLIYYGNPNAKKPSYGTDLEVTGQDPGLTVANSIYEVKLHPKSGVIDEVRLRGVEEVFAHKIETNGAVHWNPGCYAPPRPWVHASDWEPPAGMATIRGPVFAMVKRWGPLPEMPDVIVSITYRFYAGNPHIFMSSAIEVNEDIHVKALRNGEIVLNRDFINSFAWEDRGGAVHTVAVADVPQHPTHGLEIAPDTPWVAFYSREKGLAFGGIQLEWSNVRPEDGLPRLEQPYIYLQVGRWVYWARPLVYPFGSTNPQRLVLVPEGSRYYEKMAFLPFKLGAPDEQFKPMQEGRKRLTKPLYVSLHMDIDKRVPEEWVWPLLVAPFEEIIEE